MPAYAALPDVLDAFCFRTTEDDQADDFSPKLVEMLQGQCMEWDAIPAECDTGCVEYKWRLGREQGVRRISRLATQMKFRLAEGGGTAYYLLGVRDCGFAEGLSARDHSESVEVLMAAAASAKSILLLEALGSSSSCVGSDRRCSVWRLEQRHMAVSRISNEMHLCVSLADSDPVQPQVRSQTSSADDGVLLLSCKAQVRFAEGLAAAAAPLAQARIANERDSAVPLCVRT
eukprot:TRINITY_DN63127_c0_g1_i1.p1 TRINITY_DN63127_c0_g1~~TRINITY_DN63127_c0_g1_i1.p1  ORF type:complete len:231 (+),score=48.74 TRINITY_DN63127_c0_g1_i1:106-798(+)